MRDRPFWIQGMLRDPTWLEETFGASGAWDQPEVASQEK